jgi:hypothetical protein
MDTGSDLNAFELPTPILTARLASLLRTGRRDAGTKLRQLARASGGAFTARQLRQLEAGELALDGVDLLALAELYAVDISVILLERVPLTIDRATGRIRTGGITRSFELGQPEAMLIAYLKLVRELRDLQHEPTIVIRRDDVDVLADALGTDGSSVIEKLGDLMHLTVAQRRSMVTAFLAGATVIALAGGALAVDSATYEPDGDTDVDATSVSASVDIPDDALGGAPARDGVTLVWTDLDRTGAGDDTEGEGRDEVEDGPVDANDENLGAPASRSEDASDRGDRTAGRNDDGFDDERASADDADPDSHAEGAGDGEDGSGGRDHSDDEDTDDASNDRDDTTGDAHDANDRDEDDGDEDDGEDEPASNDDRDGERIDHTDEESQHDEDEGEPGESSDGHADTGEDDDEPANNDDTGENDDEPANNDDTGEDEDDGTGGEDRNDGDGDDGGEGRGDDTTDHPANGNNGVGGGVGGGREHNRGRSG